MRTQAARRPTRSTSAVEIGDRLVDDLLAAVRTEQPRCVLLERCLDPAQPGDPGPGGKKNLTDLPFPLDNRGAAPDQRMMIDAEHRPVHVLVDVP